MPYFYSFSGVLDQQTCVAKPQQNGIVECNYQYLLNVARSHRFHANLPFIFLSECILTTLYLINETLASLLSNKTPYEMLFSQTPKYFHLRVFNCLCFAFTLSLNWFIHVFSRVIHMVPKIINFIIS